MPVHPDRPIAIYHEHPDWLRPLFGALERRAHEVPWDAVIEWDGRTVVVRAGSISPS